ncbi:MAG: NAD-dependent deacylase [Spirochaetia bacterium]|nr:NAD-dependent deacylase [Spirochaetia bacterium]
MVNSNSISIARQRIRESRRLAVITGAGVSAESGIPTFRGPGGLWRNFRAEELATPEAFKRDPKLVWEWYDWRRGICKQAQPNPGHLSLAKIETTATEFLLITQNVDGLHKRAGSKRIAEIHGNIWRARCTLCGNEFDLEETPLLEIPPRCKCKGIARPDIVWFGETYDQDLLEDILDFLSGTDTLITVGTSGMVPMPVYLTRHAMSHGAFAIDLNPDESELSGIVNLSLRGKAGEILPNLTEI